MKITPNRPFPKFSRKEARVRSFTGHQKVLFLRDPFTHYVEPSVEQAAFDLLIAIGFDVEVLTTVGAGASLLSKGFLPAARSHAWRMLDELKRRDPHNSISIVGMEPSEIYSLKHDYLDLLPERLSEITTRSNKTWLLEEFLIRSVEFNKLRVGTNDKRILFQPHCHQKAESPANDGLANGTNASIELLRHLGYGVELIDAGCCGMAGTFGYEEEHYDLSQRVGALKLFPFIKNHENGFLLAATGAACRMQIVQGTGRGAVHPIVLAELVVRNLGLQNQNLVE